MQALVAGLDPRRAHFFDVRVRRGRELEDALNQIVIRPMEVRQTLLALQLHAPP